MMIQITTNIPPGTVRGAYMHQPILPALTLQPRAQRLPYAQALVSLSSFPRRLAFPAHRYLLRDQSYLETGS